MMMTTTTFRRSRTTLAAALTLGACVALGMAAVASQSRAAAGASAAVSFDDETTLHDHMEAINEHLRAIMRGVSDPAQKGEMLKHVADLQKHLLGAKAHEAPGAAAQPESEREAYILGFRKALAEVLVEVSKLEIDIIDGRAEDATNRIRGPLIDLRNKAHEKYQVED